MRIWYNVPRSQGGRPPRGHGADGRNPKGLPFKALLQSSRLSKPEKFVLLTEKSHDAEALDALLSDDAIPYGYKLVDGNLGVSGKKITLPHYMAMFLSPEIG